MYDDGPIMSEELSSKSNQRYPHPKPTLLFEIFVISNFVSHFSGDLLDENMKDQDTR